MGPPPLGLVPSAVPSQSPEEGGGIPRALCTIQSDDESGSLPQLDVFAVENLPGLSNCLQVIVTLNNAWRRGNRTVRADRVDAIMRHDARPPANIMAMAAAKSSLIERFECDNLRVLRIGHT